MIFFFFCILFFERRTDISVDKHMDLFNTFRVMHINDSEPNFVAFGWIACWDGLRKVGGESGGDEQLKRERSNMWF